MTGTISTTNHRHDCSCGASSQLAVLYNVIWPTIQLFKWLQVISQSSGAVTSICVNWWGDAESGCGLVWHIVRVWICHPRKIFAFLHLIWWHVAQFTIIVIRGDWRIQAAVHTTILIPASTLETDVSNSDWSSFILIYSCHDLEQSSGNNKDDRHSNHLGVRWILCYLDNHTVLRCFPVSTSMNSLATYGT